MSTMLPQILQGTRMLDLESKNRKVRRLSRLLQAPAHPLQRLAHLHPSPWVMAIVGCAAWADKLFLIRFPKQLFQALVETRINCVVGTSWYWEHLFFLTNDKVESGPAGPLIICCFWVLLEQTSPSTVAWAVGCLCLGSIFKIQKNRSCGWGTDRCPWRACKINAVKFSVWHSLSSDSVAFVFLPPLVAQDTWDGSKAFAPRRDQFGSGCTNFSATRNQILKALKSCF